MWGQRVAVTDVAALGCKWGRKQPGQFSILLPHWTGTAGNWIWLKVPGGHGDSGGSLTGSLCLPAVLGPQGKSILLSVANLQPPSAAGVTTFRTTPCLLLQDPGTWDPTTEQPKISLRPQRWWPLARCSGELLSSQHLGGSDRWMTCGPACATELDHKSKATPLPQLSE